MKRNRPPIGWRGSLRRQLLAVFGVALLVLLVLLLAGWVVVTEVFQVGGYAASRTAWWVLLGGTLLVGLLLGSAVSAVLSRQLLRPLQRLQAGVEQIGRGDLHHRIGLDARNEIGRVAMAFDAMAARLQECEQQIAGRAAALRASEERYRALVDNLNSGVYRNTGGSEDRFPRANPAIMTPFCPGEVVEDVAALLAEQAHEKGLELITDLPLNGPASARGDPARLRQILVNLAGNAIKFTERGEVIVRLRVETQDAARPRLRFEVQDTGIGIVPAAQGRVFASLTQADNSTPRRSGGVGLELAIARRLVRWMDGEIGVDSAPGGGSRFWFILPLTQPASSPRPFWSAGKQLSGARVLLVDDNATNREILRRRTTAWGLVAEEAENGLQALARLQDAARAGAAYHLALVDMRMPELDGLELARQIRADPTLAGLNVVLLSSSGMAALAEQAICAGIQGVLHKPVRQAELYHSLCRLLAGAADPLSRRRGTSPTPHLPRFADRILVAEDNPVNQEMAVAMLAALGYRADVAANGQEAVEAVTRNPYDLILMDWQMPVLDGFAATAAIRRWEQAEDRPRLPIVALTANIAKGFREECLAAGMDDYMSKPFEQGQLAALLERWLSVNGSVAPAPAPPPPLGILPPPTARADAATFGEESAARPASALLPDSTASPLDERALDQIRALQQPGAPNLLGKIIGLYLDSSAGLLQQIREAIAGEDGEALWWAAHSLKSSSANVGATELAAACKELEQRGRERRLADIADLLQALETHYGRAREALTLALRSVG